MRVINCAIRRWSHDHAAARRHANGGCEHTAYADRPVVVVAVRKQAVAY
jgi:hypothetical protein